MTLNGCIQPISSQSGVGVSDAVKAIVRPHDVFEGEAEEIVFESDAEEINDARKIW